MQSSRALLHATSPEALVLAPIGPSENTKAVLAVERILAFVLAAIRPDGPSHTLHHGTSPPALGSTSVLPSVFSTAFNVVRNPLAGEGRPIGPFVDAVAVLLATAKLSIETCTLRPDLHTISFLQVFAELAEVEGFVGPVLVQPKAMRNIVTPLADVFVAIVVPEAAKPRGFVLGPFTFVDSTIWPLLHPIAITLAVEPLAFVDGA
mmetsp:Transcript_51894/g.123514  ORF Transcript_51894/g.123514 Transcript_51894/m.123514 type:complete len:206 (+) Transcript_51894:165-782(+)